MVRLKGPVPFPDSVYIVHLSEYQLPDTRVFTGRARGRLDRARSNVDFYAAKAGDDQSVLFVLPEDTISVNPSYLEELLRGAYELLGKDGVRRYIRFHCNSGLDWTPNLEAALDGLARSPSSPAVTVKREEWRKRGDVPVPHFTEPEHLFVLRSGYKNMYHVIYENAYDQTHYELLSGTQVLERYGLDDASFMLSGSR
jgi:hypothetical protein